MEYDHCEQNDFNDETSITIEEAMFEYEMTEMFVQEMDDSITSNSDDEVHVPETYQIMKKKDIIIKSDSNSDIISNEKIKKNKKNYKREKKIRNWVQ